MHLIAIRRDVFEQHPWIAMNLFKMFEEAKRRCLSLITDFTCASAAALGSGDDRRDRRQLRARSLPLRHRGEPRDDRGVLPLCPRSGCDGAARDGGRSVSARGQGDGEGVRLMHKIPTRNPTPHP